ncbi:MAG: DUF1836 domain-containing protein [Ruminococcus sp.]|nr:DUF1836 domain-containing protein [Ruminococcus sp.]
MLEKIPGTQLEFEDGFEKKAFAVLTPLLSVTRGLTLGQISEVTGLQGSTIQNWIKRGWVANPRNKRYAERQVARIIIINMLKPCLQLEQIIDLMAYVNGSVEDDSDDIISDKQLFNILCYVIYLADKEQSFDKDEIKTVIEAALSDYKGPAADSKERLSQALLVMALAYLSAKIQAEAEKELKKILPLKA